MDVFHDPRGEVDISLKCLKPRHGDAARVDLGAILRYTGAPDHESYSGVYSSARTGIRQELDHAARLLREYAVPWLGGDDRLWSEVTTFAGIADQLYTEAVSKGARPEHVSVPLRKAWDDRDYGAVVRMVNQLPGRLTRGESDAYTYASGHLNVD